MLRMMERIREAIAGGYFHDLWAEFVARFYGDKSGKEGVEGCRN